jgi:hypothetical protein
MTKKRTTTMFSRLNDAKIEEKARLVLLRKEFVRRLEFISLLPKDHRQKSQTNDAAARDPTCH